MRANADTPEDARKAREFGAEGIGLCRTEHIFLGTEHQKTMQAMIMAEADEDRQERSTTCWSSSAICSGVCSRRCAACR